MKRSKIQEYRGGQVDLAACLALNSLFQTCSAETLQTLASRSSVNVAPRGTKILENDSPFPSLGFVCEGVVAVTHTADGPVRGVHRVQLYQARAGEVFGGIALLAGCPPIGYVYVVSKYAVYALMPAASIIEATERHPEFLRRLSAHAASRARDLALRLLGNYGWPVTARIAKFLLQYANGESGMQPANPQLADFVQRDIAAAAGCVKEAAARAIAELEGAGALQREHGHIRRLDRNTLAKFLHVEELPSG